MARQPRTPGATTEVPKATEAEVVTKTIADQAEAALDAILGTPETTEPTDEQKEYEEFLEWKKNRAGAATQPVAQHVPASSVGSEPVAKRTRQVLTDDGWTSEEY